MRASQVCAILVFALLPWREFLYAQGRPQDFRPAHDAEREKPSRRVAHVLTRLGGPRTKGAVYTVAVASKGNLFAAGSGKEIRLWRSGKRPGRLVGHRGEVRALAFSPVGGLLASGSDDGKIRLWNPKTDAFVGSLPFPDVVHAVAFSPMGKHIAGAGSFHTVHVWQVFNGVRLHELAGAKEGTRALAFSPDGERLAAAGADGLLRVWTLEDGKRALLLAPPGDMMPRPTLRAIAYVSEGTAIAAAGGGALHLFDAAKGIHIRSIPIRPRGVMNYQVTEDALQVTALTSSGKGRFLAGAVTDHSVRVWRMMSGEETGCFTGHQAPVYDLAFFPDGKRIASCDASKLVLLWVAPMHEP